MYELLTYQYVNFKLRCLDNVKEPHNSTSVEDSKKLHASRGDEDERDADKSAVNEASDPRKKKKCQDQKATGNGNAGHKGQLLHVQISQTWPLLQVKLDWNCSFKAKINDLL